MALMLDHQRYKGLSCVHEFVGKNKNHGDCTQICPTCLLPVLVKVNDFLNLAIVTSFPFVETLAIDLIDFLFDGPSCLIEFFREAFSY
jgi:hypothetical protein